MSDEIKYNLVPCPECKSPALAPELIFLSKRNPDAVATVCCCRCQYRIEADGKSEIDAKANAARVWGVVNQVDENEQDKTTASDPLTEGEKSDAASV